MSDELRVNLYQVRDYLDLHTPAELKAPAVSVLRAMADHAVYKGNDYGKVIFRAAVYDAAKIEDRSVIQGLMFVTRTSEDTVGRAIKLLAEAEYIIRNRQGRKNHQADTISVLPLLARVAEFYSAESGLQTTSTPLTAESSNTADSGVAARARSSSKEKELQDNELHHQEGAGDDESDVSSEVSLGEERKAQEADGAEPREDRGAEDELQVWAAEHIGDISEFVVSKGMARVNNTKRLRGEMIRVSGKHSQDVVEKATAWCVLGWAENHRSDDMRTVGGYLTDLLESVVEDYLAARSAALATMPDANPDEFDLVAWLHEQEETRMRTCVQCGEEFYCPENLAGREVCFEQECVWKAAQAAEPVKKELDEWQLGQLDKDALIEEYGAATRELAEARGVSRESLGPELKQRGMDMVQHMKREGKLAFEAHQAMPPLIIQFRAEIAKLRKAKDYAAEPEEVRSDDIHKITGEEQAFAAAR